MVTFILVIVGGLNWGLTAVGYNVVHMILGTVPSLETLVYILVGLSAVYLVVDHKKTCKMCSAGTGM
jgi:uncharacterized membrane protein YuzA (DUF378 family)